jgi:hypothetical protein
MYGGQRRMIESYYYVLYLKDVTKLADTSNVRLATNCGVDDLTLILGYVC